MIGLRGDQAMPVLEKALAGRVTLADFRAEWSLHRGELERGGTAVRPGVIELLERLAERSPPCAVPTSTQRAIAEELLERTGIARFFRTVTGSDDVVEPKPVPEIYLKAAASLGVEAHACCAFEDSGPGTRAAVSSGGRSSGGSTDSGSGRGGASAPSTVSGGWGPGSRSSPSLSREARAAGRDSAAHALRPHHSQNRRRHAHPEGMKAR